MKITKNEMMMGASYLLAFIAFSFAYGYYQTYLIHLGYDATQRGLMFTGAAIVAIAFQLIAGYLCDYFRSDKLVYNVGMALMMVSVYFLFSYSEQIFWFHLLFTSLVGGLCRTIMAVQDAWCLEIDETCKAHYGPLRSMGSIGWMFGTTVGAMIITSYGYGVLALVFCALGLLNIAFSAFIQDAIKVQQDDKRIQIQDLKILFTNKRYVLIVMTFLIVNMISAADMYTVVDKMIALGADETLIGQRWSIQALCELPLFFAGTYLLNKFKGYKVMVFGIVMYILKFVGYGIVQTPELMVAVACLQGLSFPFIMITSKTIVDENTPVQLRASGQTIASAIYLGVALLITPIIAAMLSEQFGLDLTLYIFAASGLIALVLASIYQKIPKKVTSVI